MIETIGNLHMHTLHSDGSGTHDDLVQAAARAGLDWIIVTDHNVRPGVPEGWRDAGGGRRVLMLLGEEVHDTARQPQANHLLCLGIQSDIAHLAADPQALLDAVNGQGGVAIAAHPIEFGTRLVDEELPWVDWQVTGLTGIELWNTMSEVKAHTVNVLQTLALAFFPRRFLRGPFPETLALWDRLMQEKSGPVYAVGGADAHANTYRLGPLRRVLYPYEFLFRSVNTHALLAEPFTGEVDADRWLLADALRHGRCWVGYDGLSPTKGVRFEARQDGTPTPMGGEVACGDGGIRLEFSVPEPAELCLLRDGALVAQADGTTLAHEPREPGFYRAEAWRRRWGGRRGWVFTNPIHVT